MYSLRPIILFANVDVSRHILVVDTSVLAKSNMDRREYKHDYLFWVSTTKGARYHNIIHYTHKRNYNLEEKCWLQLVPS
jgi:hypothetical protein